MTNPFTKPVVVIDNGSHNIKAGFACDNHPVSSFRTTVGRPKYLQGSYGKTPYEVYIGDDAVARRDELDLSYPVVQGKIIHWDNMERVWHHIFYRELKSAPEDRAVLLSCAPATTIKDKIKCCDIFFESLNVPALCLKPQSFLALFGAGLTTGLSVDLGQDSTEINPLYEGGSITYANMTTNIAGLEIERYILDCLEKRGIDLGNDSESVINDIWNLIYITENCAVTKEQYKKEYKLPNGEVIDVSDEVFMAGEMYFQPELVLGEKSNQLSIQDAMVTSILKVEEELQSEMYDSIVTYGGCLTMPGFNKRLSLEIEKIINRPVAIMDRLEPYSLAWMGGAVFAGMQGSSKMWIQKKQFEEYGEKLVRTKFL